MGVEVEEIVLLEEIDAGARERGWGLKATLKGGKTVVQNTFFFIYWFFIYRIHSIFNSFHF